MAKRRMAASVSQQEAVDLFGLPTKMLYVCDGKKACGKPCCRDLANDHVCHHTEDLSHALYDEHHVNTFEQLSAVRDGEAAVICVEPIRG